MSTWFLKKNRNASDDDSDGGYANSENEGEIIGPAIPVIAIPAPVIAVPQVLLKPNGQQWYDNGEVTEDRGILYRRTRLTWPVNVNLVGDALPVRAELDYFRLFYPIQLNIGTEHYPLREILESHFLIPLPRAYTIHCAKSSRVTFLHGFDRLPPAYADLHRFMPVLADVCRCLWSAVLEVPRKKYFSVCMSNRVPFRDTESLI